jgi:hypothetical protein
VREKSVDSPPNKSSDVSTDQSCRPTTDRELSSVESRLPCARFVLGSIYGYTDTLLFGVSLPIAPHHLIT